MGCVVGFRQTAKRAYLDLAPQDTRRVAPHNRSRRHAIEDNRARADDRPVANGDSWQDRASAADKTMATDVNRPVFPSQVIPGVDEGLESYERAISDDY